MHELVNATEQPSRNIAAVAAREENPAEYMYERMLQMIEAHQDRLPEDYELGVQVIGGGAPPFHLRQISYSNPDILIFLGKDSDGNIVQLMQHHTQMSVVLLSMPKLEEKPYRVGFTAK
jgi:hypothetical protein